MRICRIASLGIAFVLTAGNLFAAEGQASAEAGSQLQSIIKSLSKGVLILTDEIGALRKENQQIRAELQEIKSCLETPKPTKAKTPGALQVEREYQAQQDREAESADDVFQAFEYSLSKLRSKRLSLFSEIVSVEIEAVAIAESMRLSKSALAQNLEIDDEKLRKGREDQLRKAYKQASEMHTQLVDRVEALNAELSVVEKKLEHLEKRIKEAKAFRK